MNETAITTQDWYTFLVDDCKNILTQRIKNARFEKLMAYLELGERIVKDANYQKYSQGNQKFVTGLFLDIGVGKTLGYDAIHAYEKFFAGKEVSANTETLYALGEGENISWDKLRTKYLPEKKKDEVIEEYIICPRCHGTGKVHV